VKRLGIDIGSLTLNAVLISESGIAERASFEHAGRIESAVHALLQRPEFSSFDTAGATGSLAGTGKGIIDNTLATIEGARHLLPGCRNVIAMGGQGFSLILLDDNGLQAQFAGANGGYVATRSTSNNCNIIFGHA